MLERDCYLHQYLCLVIATVEILRFQVMNLSYCFCSRKSISKILISDEVLRLVEDLLRPINNRTNIR